jgi:hypothetical protein
MGKRAELTIRETFSVRGVETVGMIWSLISSELSIKAQGNIDLDDKHLSPLKSDI